LNKCGHRHHHLPHEMVPEVKAPTTALIDPLNRPLRKTKARQNNYSPERVREGTTTLHHVQIIFTRGHETDPQDHGRPVVLIAASLNVAPEVFRTAFSNVKPASGGREPEPAQVRLNKETLLKTLGPYGITN
jgi:hypothetical protein